MRKEGYKKEGKVNTTKAVCERLQVRGKWSPVQCLFCLARPETCGQSPKKLDARIEGKRNVEDYQPVHPDNR